MVACSRMDSATESSSIYQSYENLAKKPSAEIFHEDDWTIVSLTENGDRVYWFLAPEIDNVTPAMFKKTVHTGGEDKPKTRIVSDCHAPKQICVDLKKQFNALSEKYN